MAQQLINLGATGTGAGGDSARTAFEKAVANFAELYIAALPGTTAQKAAARAQFGIPTLQTGADDLTSGRLALTDTVRRQLAGGFYSIYCDRLILLHPLYVSSLLPYSIVDGKITATRGAATSFLNQTCVEVVSSSAYSAHTTSLYDLGGSPAEPWQAVSCTYQGVKYAALIVPYHASAYGAGIFFEGRAVSVDSNQLLCIEYYNRNTAAVLNAEVYNSIAPLSVQKTFRVGGETTYHTGNVIGTVSRSGAGALTGAIIERGSNANGEYVRFADGTQECWKSTHSSSATRSAWGSSSGLYQSANTAWQYPASFSETPVVTGISYDSGAVGLLSATNVGTTNVNLRAISPTPSPTSQILCPVAKGRWY